jgi:hypothetical protein
MVNFIAIKWSQPVKMVHFFNDHSKSDYFIQISNDQNNLVGKNELVLGGSIPAVVLCTTIYFKIMFQELLNFHQKWYSANIMGLAVVGKQSLDELETSVIDLFSGKTFCHFCVICWLVGCSSQECSSLRILLFTVHH